MNIPNITGLVKVGKTFLMANRPEILLGTAITATISAVVMAAKGGYEARGLVIDAEMDKGEKLDVKEKVQLTWLCYLPAGITTLGSLGSLCGLHFVHVKEKKALVTASLAAIEEVKATAQTYQDKAIKLIDDESKTPEEKKAALQAMDIRDSEEMFAVQDLYLGDGMYACWDDLANRPFKSNRGYILSAAQSLLGEIQKHGYANLNYFYSELQMLESQLGAQVGWTREDVAGYGGKNGLEFVQFGLTDLPDGSSAISVWFREPPTSDYMERAQSAIGM